MFRFGDSHLGSITIAATLVLVIATACPAQQDRRGDNSYRSAGDSHDGGSGGGDRSAADAWIVVHVPSSATIWIDDFQTSLEGETRTFRTPRLNVDKTFSYHVRARWTDDRGDPVERTRRVDVRGGSRQTVDFTRASESNSQGRDEKSLQRSDRYTKATITKINLRKKEITLRMKGRDGNEVVKTFKLAEDIRYLDSNGKAVEIDVFRSGHEVLVIEAEGMLTQMRQQNEK